MSAKTIASQLLAEANIRINGTRPWDVRVHNEKMFARVMRHGSLGLGESYMDGWWDAKSLDQLFDKLLSAELENKVRPSVGLMLSALGSVLLNPQTKSRAFKIGEHHYDIGNDLYETMLDKRMVYTCGYWNPSASSGQAMTLDEAQEAKLDLVCRKLNVKKGQTILDIGCGWGSFLKFAAEKYGVRGVGVTVSKEQVKLARKMCAGLPIKIVLQDYRDVKGQFDHIVSLGMFEHVGVKNYRTYMEVVRKHLNNDGLFLLHTIGGNRSVTSTDPWISKYIFPNSMIPSAEQIMRATEGLFVLEDWHSFGAYYDKTLMAWWKNFHAGWPQLKASGKYSNRFYRMWKYYLLACAGSFRARKNQLWQIVLSKDGVAGGYRSVR